MPFAADRPSRTRGAVPSEDSAAAAQRQVWAAGCWAWLADQRAGRRTARRQRRRSERAVPTWPAAVRREGQPAMGSGATTSSWWGMPTSWNGPLLGP